MQKAVINTDFKGFAKGEEVEFEEEMSTPSGETVVLLTDKNNTPTLVPLNYLTLNFEEKSNNELITDVEIKYGDLFYSLSRESDGEIILSIFDNDHSHLTDLIVDDNNEDLTAKLETFYERYKNAVRQIGSINEANENITLKEYLNLPYQEREKLNQRVQSFYLEKVSTERPDRNKFNYMYDRLLKIAPGILELLESAEYPSDVYGKSQYRTSDFDGDDAYMHLAIEGLDKDSSGRYLLSMAHYYIQNGDMMCDPCMTVRMDPINQTLEAMSFKMDGVIGGGIVKEVYKISEDGRLLVNQKEKTSQNKFLNNWTSNLVNMGHIVKFEPLDSTEELTDISTTKTAKEDTFNSDFAFQYQMLSRLKIDNDYWLGAGGRHDKHLWAGSAPAQIAEMRRIWDELPEYAKPEWLTLADINDYEFKMITPDITAGDIVKRKTGGTARYEVIRTYGQKMDLLSADTLHESEGIIQIDFEKVSESEAEEVKAKIAEERLFISQTPDLTEQLSKFPIVVEWTEAGLPINNKGYNTLEELESDIKKGGFTDNPNMTYVKWKIYFDGKPERIDVSKSERDFDFEKQTLKEYLNENYPSIKLPPTTIEEILDDDELGLLDSPKLSKQEEEIVEAWRKGIDQAITNLPYTVDYTKYLGNGWVPALRVKGITEGNIWYINYAPINYFNPLDRNLDEERAKYKHALSLGFKVKDIRAGKYGNIYFLHKGNEALTKHGFENIYNLDKDSPDAEPISKEAQSIIKDEWNKMKEYLGLPPDDSNSISIDPEDYKNQYDLNKAIEAFIASKPDDYIYGNEEKSFIYSFSGYGGLEKYGATGQGLLWEYFTPKELIKKMWGLAFKYGFNSGKILEPSIGVGRFLDYTSDNDEVVGYDINEISAKICKIIHPKTRIIESSFSQHFYNGNTYNPNFEKDFDLVIGNPPYGSMTDIRAVAEAKRLKVSIRQYEHYFILRGLDVLKPGGLLVYVSTANLFTKGYEQIKEKIAERANLIDGYLLPNKTFQNTEIGTSLIVLRKK